MEVLGIDFGGSGIKGAPVNIETGELLAERHRIPTPAPSTPEAVSVVVQQLIEHFNWRGKVGIGFPSVVQNGIIRTAANIDNSWIGYPVNRFLSEKTGCEVFAVNDADAAGLAEMKLGAGKDQSGLVMLLTIGTGVGTVLFMNGQLMPNSELGHLQFKDSSVELYVSDAVKKNLDLSWKKWAKRFNEALTYYEQLFYPDLFIVGGGTSKRFDKFQEYLEIKTRIIPAQLLNDAGLVGAALFAGL